MTRVQGEYFTQGFRDPTHQNDLGWIDSQRLKNMVGEVVTGTGTSGLHLAPRIRATPTRVGVAIMQPCNK